MAESFTTRLIQRLQIEQKKNDHGGVYAFAQRTLAYLKILQTVIRSENTRIAEISYRILQLHCRKMFTRA